MKTLLTVLLTLLAASPGYAMDKGEEAPNFRFEASWNTLPGARQLTDYRGKIVFLEIWKIH
ncbi:hypothetical protein EDM80_07180 [bacterium]|nr:MAG: hypothetical protein EDM80_07180 [bacterium]RIK65400.1 MAG: hypothetical protein DCC64_01825 [Planctomycetota bacterium]